MGSDRIRAIPLFAGLSDEDAERLAAVASVVELETGTTLTQEGEFGHAMFAIEEGGADVLADGRLIRTVGAGDVVGEIAVLASGRRTATIVTTSPTRLIALFKRDVWAIERTSPEAAARLRGLLTDHLEPVEQPSA